MQSSSCICSFMCANARMCSSSSVYYCVVEAEGIRLGSFLPSLTCLRISAFSEPRVCTWEAALSKCPVSNKWGPGFMFGASVTGPEAWNAIAAEELCSRSGRARVGHRSFCPCKDLKPKHAESWDLSERTWPAHLPSTLPDTELYCAGAAKREGWHFFSLSRVLKRGWIMCLFHFRDVWKVVWTSLWT